MNREVGWFTAQLFTDPFSEQKPTLSVSLSLSLFLVYMTGLVAQFAASGGFAEHGEFCRKSNERNEETVPMPLTFCHETDRQTGPCSVPGSTKRTILDVISARSIYDSYQRKLPFGHITQECDFKAQWFSERIQLGMHRNKGEK